MRNRNPEQMSFYPSVHVPSVHAGPVAFAAALLFLAGSLGCRTAMLPETSEREASEQQVRAYPFSEATRIGFKLTPDGMREVQFYASGRLVYENVAVWQQEVRKSDEGTRAVTLRRTVDEDRIVIRPGTPGVVVGADTAAWQHVDVDFGRDFVVRFHAGYGGRVGSARPAGAALETSPPASAQVSQPRPILYYAPASTLVVGGHRYRLDRREYDGGVLTFGGSFRVEEERTYSDATLEGRRVVALERDTAAQDVTAGDVDEW